MKLGRPALPPGQARTVTVRLLVTPAERDELERLASSAGLTLSEHIRKSLRLTPWEGYRDPWERLGASADDGGPSSS